MSKYNNITRTSKLFLIIVLLFIINIISAAATIDLVNPTNNTYSNQQEIVFDYYVNIDGLTECDLVVDSNIALTNTTPVNSGFNQFILCGVSPGNHTWGIICNTTNSSESSEERIIIIDVAEPTVVLFNPQNSTQVNTSSIELSFVALDNLALNLNCSIIINNSVNQYVLVNNSQPATATISPLSDGNYTWKVTCVDYANNIKASETRNFIILSTPPLPDFRIFIDSTEYVIGQTGQMSISAPAGTNVRVEVCPNQTGFVECKVPVNAQNVTNYPFQEYLPFTNYAGNYILEAFFNYSGATETKTQSYLVNNNIHIDIDTERSQRRNVPVELEAEISGGIAPLNYSWRLSDGSIINKTKTNITYTTAGNYTNTFVVKDAYNNTRNASITVEVDNTYSIKIIIKDAETNAVLQGATVEIEDEQKTTDYNGEADYYLEEGRRDILILRQNYSEYDDKLNITKDETFTILLEPKELKQTPVITLMFPENNSAVQGPDEELVYKAEYNKELNCSVYINENNDGFFIYLGSDIVSSNAEQRFGVIELENKSYWWKVECVDTKDHVTTGLSQTWKFNVGGAELLALTANSETSGEYATYNEWIKELEQLISTFSSLPKEEKEAADALNINGKIDESIQFLKNTIRDLDSLRFRNDLSDSQKQEEGEKYVQASEAAYQKTPISIQLLASDSFVDYISKEELQSLLEEYLKIKGLEENVNVKQALEYLDALQQEIVVSTKVKTARINYRDGSQSDASIIFREIKTYNITEGAFILELIPKDVVETADNIVSAQKFEVIKQDPIIRFELKGDSTITYYFDASIDAEFLKKIRTAVFVEPDAIKAEERITGFSIKNLKLPKLKGIIYIPVIIILLGGLVFAGVRYDGINTAKYIFYKTYGRRNLHYLNVILNEINDHLEAGNLNKAHELYEEAKGAYAELSDIAKNDIYERVEEAANSITSYYHAVQSQSRISEINNMITNIQRHISSAQLMPALEEYKKIEHAYNELNDEHKEMLHPTLVQLGNQIQIMIDNTKNLI